MRPPRRRRDAGRVARALALAAGVAFGSCSDARTPYSAASLEGVLPNAAPELPASVPAVTPAAASTVSDREPVSTTTGSTDLQAASTTPAAESQDSIPVLLVPGWSDDEGRLASLNTRLTSSGWAPARVQMLSFEDPVGSNRDHAREIAEAALALKSRTAAERIDIVAHSMGGLATRYYLQNGGDAHVRRVVFLATPHRGTLSAYLGWGEGAREMEPQSSFLLGLLRAHAVPPGVRAITIRTPLDLHIVPIESAMLPGVPNLEVCCPTHAGLLDDDETFELIARFLRDSR